MRASTIPTMSDYEEDFGDFPSENKKESKESLGWSISRRVDMTIYAGSGIKTKNPPLFDGSRAWFRYEELIED